MINQRKEFDGKLQEQMTEIKVNDKGTPVIAEANFKVLHIAMDYQEFGNDVAEIQKQHPFLTKTQIRAAISYYLNHKKMFDAKIRESIRQYEILHSESVDSPIRQKIRAMRNKI